jgi:hypothetical protein
MLRFLRCLIIIFIPVSFTQAETIHVPGDYPAIQEGIDASQEGDIILVAPGTYWENINFLGKNITVKSEEGPGITLIDGGEPTNRESLSVVRFMNQEGPDAMLHGFTLVNGTGTYISHFPAAGYCGGGIVCYRSSPTLKDNIIKNNSAGFGGGIASWGDGSPLISDNLIHNNDAYYGGGIQVMSMSGLTNHAHIRNNMIFNNTAQRGGGIECHNYESAPSIVNNTLYGNVAYLTGGGIRSAVSHPFIVNTILWNNQAATGKGHELSLTALSKVHIDYSIVQGGLDQVFKDGSSKITWGAFNLNEDPLFADPSNYDLHLTYTSPGRDSGDHSVPGLSLEDFEGDPRTAFGAVDRGADEFHTHLYYTGNAVPGQWLDLKVVALPQRVVFTGVGSGIMDPPLSTQYGDWFLTFPVYPLPSGMTTWEGLMIRHVRIPLSIPTPSRIPLQALARDELTNLCVLEVE